MSYKMPESAQFRYHDPRKTHDQIASLERIFLIIIIQAPTPELSYLWTSMQTRLSSMQVMPIHVDRPAITSKSAQKKKALRAYHRIGNSSISTICVMLSKTRAPGAQHL